MTLVNGAGTAANSEIAAVLFCAGLLPQCVVCCVTWEGGMTDMGFFYKLFNGEICPIENLVRQMVHRGLRGDLAGCAGWLPRTFERIHDRTR